MKKEDTTEQTEQLREQVRLKVAAVEALSEQVKSFAHFYITDTSGLNAQLTSDLRRLCHKSEIKMLVVKNSLFKRCLASLATDTTSYEELNDSLKGSTSIMLTNTGNAPAKLIKEFRKTTKNEKPLFKAAYVEESFYIGAEQLDVLANIKSKDELIGDVITLLQSPIKNTISALQSGGTILSGIVKTLSEKSE